MNYFHCRHCRNSSAKNSCHILNEYKSFNKQDSPCHTGDKISLIKGVLQGIKQSLNFPYYAFCFLQISGTVCCLFVREYRQWVFLSSRTIEFWNKARIWLIILCYSDNLLPLLDSLCAIKGTCANKKSDINPTNWKQILRKAWKSPLELLIHFSLLTKRVLQQKQRFRKRMAWNNIIYPRPWIQFKKREKHAAVRKCKHIFSCLGLYPGCLHEIVSFCHWWLLVILGCQLQLATNVSCFQVRFLKYTYLGIWHLKITLSQGGYVSILPTIAINT